MEKPDRRYYTLAVSVAHTSNAQVDGTHCSGKLNDTTPILLLSIIVSVHCDSYQ